MGSSGRNRKSMASMENVAAFFEHVPDSSPCAHCYNDASSPDLTMIERVDHAMSRLSERDGRRLRRPYVTGLAGRHACDLLSSMTGRRLPIRAIRVRKFWTNTRVDATRVHSGIFEAPMELRSGLDRMADAQFGASGA